MLTYWLLYLIPAGIALFVKQSPRSNLMPWIYIGFFFILIIGFRFDVGGDWSNYLRNYNDMQGLNLFEMLRHGDPGHQFLTWVSQQWDLGVYGINMFYGTIFMIGLIKFSRLQTYPWISMAVAVPYMVIVVAMGYSRQAIAIGLFMFAISYLQKGNFKTYVVLIITAALFHKTALLLLPFGVFLSGSRGIILRVLMIIPIAYGVWDMLLSEQQEHLWRSYVEEQMESTGAKIRVVMNLFPSLLLLMFRKEWKRSFNDYTFWYWIALGSIISVGLVGFASTAVDRIALYFIPIQLIVYARLPYLVRKQISPMITKFMIILAYTAVLFIWLHFAAHAYAWVPYDNIIFREVF